MDRGFARLLIISGLVLLGAGLLVLVSPRIPWLGRLPGDLRLGRGNVRIYAPIATCLLLSLLASILLHLIRRR